MSQVQGEAVTQTWCASCTNEADDLVAEEQDGKRVLLCGACREGSVRLFTFAGGRDVSRFRTVGGATVGANTAMGDGNRRRGGLAGHWRPR